MTPQEFADTLVPPEEYRRVAIVAALPMYAVSQWMSAVQQVLKQRNAFDQYGFRINPMRLWGFIDGITEPRLSVTFYEALHGEDDALRGVPRAGLIIIREITL